MLNDDFEIDEMEDFEEMEPIQEELIEEKPNEEKSTEEEPVSDTASLETIAISDIPIKIQLEVSRFEVSLSELSRMEPGYKLPIEINPRIVNLTVSGKVIGKGEIIEIGDTIGVKILELYHK